VLSPPAALSADDLVETLAAGWGLRVASLDYRAVGFGSHHWAVVAADGARWFVTVYELEDDTFDRLTASLSTARALRAAGREFVAAPVSTVDGAVVVRLGPAFAVAVYPFVEGRSFDWGHFTAPAHRDAVRDMVVGVHTAPPDVRRLARVDDFAIPHLSTLDALVPDAGPYSARVAALLAAHDPEVRARLRRYDDLVARADPARAVLTHGEPHPGNTMLTADGWRLIDWDTVLVAQPERDLWSLDPGDGSVLAAYAEATGVRALPEMLELFRVRWAVADIAEFVATLSRPHTGDANDAESWRSLEATVASLP
jgi:spectinomycin phosphotransferase/16S rRNA (guanine(1405)-N(7))-methyltransferase